MGARTFALVGAAGSLIAAGMATADLTQVSLRFFVGDGWVENGYDSSDLVTYRLYAIFDGNGDDGVLSAFGVSGLPMSARSHNGRFENSPPGLDSLTAPQDLRFLGIWENQWDTYVTINATVAQGDATTLSPGFATQTNSLASDWETQNAGWFVTPDDDQSRAQDIGFGELGVLLAQFTVSRSAEPQSGALVAGTINLLLRDGTQVEQVFFPAPGGLAALAIAGLAGCRRRRR